MDIATKQFLHSKLLSFVFTVYFICSAPTAIGQVSLRDIYGNQMPSNWPPPVGDYEPNSLTIWFNRDMINHDFLCNYWYLYHNPMQPLIKDSDSKKEKLLSSPYISGATGCFELTPLLFTDTELYNVLDSLGVTSLCQYSMLSPCEDTLAQTLYGYNIRTPEFWNSFYVSFDSDISLSALIALLLKFGGSKIDFAELNFYAESGSGSIPNDSLFGEQTAYLDKSYQENIVGAWDMETGSREIRVGIIDGSMDYMHPDLGAGKGEGYPILGGECMIKHLDSIILYPYDTTYLYDPVLPLLLSNHYKAVGGTIVDTTVIDTFIVIAPYQGESLIEPTDTSGDLAKYKADRYRVQKKIVLNGWEIARSWGRSGDGTLGWSAAMPLDPGFNILTLPGDAPIGYSRVVGEALPGDTNFNPNNLRDISYRNDTITLETFCYRIFERPDTLSLYVEKGIYPDFPDSVIYRYSIWGILREVSVQDDSNNIEVNSVDCEVRTILGEQRVYIHYIMDNPGPVNISIFDNIGNQVFSFNRNYWSENGKNTYSVSLRDIPSGIYHISVSGNNSISRCSFNFIR